MIKEGLTKSEAGAKMKKDKEILILNQEGDIRKIKASKLKRNIKQKRQPLDIRYLNVGFYLVTPILAGVFLGLGIDYWLRTKPLFFSLFLLLGTLSCFYNLFKLMKDV